jgi:hypothetical protein
MQIQAKYCRGFILRNLASDPQRFACKPVKTPGKHFCIAKHFKYFGVDWVDICLEVMGTQVLDQVCTPLLMGAAHISAVNGVLLHRRIE